MKKNLILLCLTIISIATLTGCVSMVITKMEPDPAVANLTISERYQRYQKESLGLVGKTIIDGQGNTLSSDDLKKLLKEKKDTDALKDLSRSFVPFGIGSLLVAGLMTYECFWLSDKVESSASYSAIMPYAVFGLGATWVSYRFLFDSNFKTTLNTLSATNKYNDHLRQRLGLEQPVNP